MSTVFNFPFNFKLNKSKALVKANKYTVDGINILNYVTAEEVDFAYSVIVFNTKLTLVKGSENIKSSAVYEVINTTHEEEPFRMTSHKYLFITTLPSPLWSFNNMTSNYQRERNQYYIKVTLEDGNTEMDVLNLASGLTYYYGYQFTPHTVSEQSGIYHITLASKSTNTPVNVFNDIASKVKDIYKASGLDIEVKVNRKVTESNILPAPSYEFDF
jgi:hypothetical protein